MLEFDDIDPTNEMVPCLYGNPSSGVPFGWSGMYLNCGGSIWDQGIDFDRQG